jgi:hypothetical protein
MNNRFNEYLVSTEARQPRRPEWTLPTNARTPRRRRLTGRGPGVSRSVIVGGA